MFGWNQIRKSRHRLGGLASAGIAALAVTVGGTAATLTGVAFSAPHASAATPCVDQTFDYLDVNLRLGCVVDEQVLLNNLRNRGIAGPNQLLAVDGQYGPHTSDDVAGFNSVWTLNGWSGETNPQTWRALCAVNYRYGFHGVYWAGAGCTPSSGRVAETGAAPNSARARPYGIASAAATHDSLLG